MPRLNHDSGDVPHGGGQRLVILSQVYPPDPAAVGQHLADVAEAMVRRGWRVTVFTASRGYDDPSVRYAARETRAGVEVRRLGLSSFGKRSVAIRLLAQLSLVVQALPRIACVAGLSCLLVSTSPPFAGFFGAVVAAVRRVPLVWWVMDVNPDQLVAIGRMSAGAWPVRVFEWMNRQALRAARDVIVLDRRMKQVMQRKSQARISMHVIPPWAGTEPRADRAVGDNPFRRRLGCDGRLVVMYSGNHAITSPLTTLLAAIRSMGDTSGLLFAFVGGGAGKAEVETLMGERPDLPVRSLPYQPRESLPESLAAADVHVVSLADEAVGLVHPCKLYGAMAVGKPVIALAPLDSYVGEIVTVHGIGWRVSHGDVEGMVGVLGQIREAGPAKLRAMGQAAERLVMTMFERDAAIAAVCDVVEGAGQPAATSVTGDPCPARQGGMP